MKYFKEYMMTKNGIKQIIRKLKNYELDIRNVPEEIMYHKDIVAAERKYGLRIEKNRGYDIIRNLFFVEEEVFYRDYGELTGRNESLTFERFEEYYDYLDGDIYNQSCYMYCDFDKYRSFIRKNNIIISKLQERETFLTGTIDDVVLDASKEELELYEAKEKNKKLIKIWMKKFDACKCGFDLEVAVNKYNRSKLSGILDVTFFFYNYIFKDTTDKIRFKAVMEYMCTGKEPEYKIIKALCSIYNPNEVLKSYDYSGGTKQTNYKHKKKLKDYVKKLEDGLIAFKTKCFFDDKSHYFCEEVEGFEGDNKWPIVSYQRYFETFELLAEYRKGNLNGADFSKALNLDVDFSKYEVNEKTMLPLYAISDLECKVYKEYQNGKFIVWKNWYTKNGGLVKNNIFVTPYFFDFVYYLKNDLSNSFLVFCDGLENLPSLSGINLDGVKMTSKLCDKFGIEYERYNLNEVVIGSFDITEKNENETSLTSIGNESFDIELSNCHTDNNYKRIYYITDLHLMHRLQNAKCRSEYDVRYILQNIVDSIADNIVYEAGTLLLIGGDVSSDFKIFKKFINLLKCKFSNMRYGRPEVVFILGNHELWDFPDKDINEIVEMYRLVVEENDMILLHNELLYKSSDDKINKISYEDLISMSSDELRKRIQSTSIIILGGLGFSGYNEDFNANQGVYRASLDRTREIIETKKFEELYNKVLPSIRDKNTIIFTHTPKKDWCVSAEPYKGFVYVSGHTHRNEFYDDGDYRIYSDNQIGYRNEKINLKSFLLDSKYDFFSDYEDGIYKITGAQYNDFYRGKNLQMKFSREIHILYMLKKNGYYCFIHKSKSGSLSILNGGAWKKLETNDIYYYYNHMDGVIAHLKKPLDEYMRIQQHIADEVKKFGGVGTIHGCIIDINWYNHIYVNPVDLSVTGYWALNMIDKIVYPDVATLLKVECPELYSNYIKLIKDKHNNPLVAPNKKNNEITVLPQEYLSTDIYRVSRELNKMQKLTSNILSSWYDTIIKIE